MPAGVGLFPVGASAHVGNLMVGSGVFEQLLVGYVWGICGLLVMWIRGDGSGRSVGDGDCHEHCCGVVVCCSSPVGGACARVFASIAHFRWSVSRERVSSRLR